MLTFETGFRPRPQAAPLRSASLRSASLRSSPTRSALRAERPSQYAFDQHMLMIYVFLVVVAAVLAAVGALGLATATSLNVLDRRRELGVLRAIGATPRTIGAIVVIEAVFLVLMAWALGVMAAWLITAGLGALMSNLLSLLRARGGLDVSLSPEAVAGWLAISLVLAIVASLAPAWSASRRSIREAISYD